ncbi:MAG TPA: hypothetical protein VHT74_11140 [Acetobacteraceae bacterium]|jgi:hypothetical protein|nr:hypothetical protein [Acetobacteraceae bacterium]
MKTMILATAAVLGIGIGAAYAGDGEDGGITPNTYFSELPGEIATAHGQPPNSVAVNNSQLYGMDHASAAPVVPPNANARPGG